MNGKLERYHAAQSWFAKNLDIYTSPRLRAMEIISKKICEVMNIQRVGFWMYTINRDAIFEEMTFILNGKITKGDVLTKQKYPTYFNFIQEEQVVTSNDTRKDYPLHEFVESYMIPHNVHALLDAPIFSDGKMIGILCLEDTAGPREWDIYDKLFSSSCSDFVGRLIEAEKRHAYENELKHRINYLENDLQKKLDDLKEAKLNLDLALDGAQAGKWDWEIETDKLILNRTWFSRLGYEWNEIPQELSTFKKVLHPDDIEKVFQVLDSHLRGETAFYECRFRMIAKSGEIQFTIDRGCVTKRAPDGRPLRMTGVNINITPVVQLEQSLISSQEQLKAMIYSLPTPVAMFDKEFKYLAFSTRWEQEWGKINKVELGQNFANLYVEFKNELYGHLNMALQGKTISHDEDYVQVTEDLQLWLRWIIQPWKLATGEIGGVVIMCENITHRKEAEMKITQSSKLAALGEMAGGIAHEINNPLSIIKGYVDLLKRHASRNTLNQEITLQYIDKMDQTIGRISRIVNGMRRFSRESSMDEKVPYSLNKIIDETLDICLERINNNGTALTVDYFQNDATVFCRPIEISQAFLNLINNSFQAISSLPHPWIKIECSEFQGGYQLKFIDCGPGIPNNIRQKLFQPFFTTKDIGIGTGLGLSISRGIIEEHQGLLQYSAEGPNTTFVIRLPKWNKEDTEKLL